MHIWALLCILLVCLSESLGEQCGGDKGDCGTCSALYSTCNAVDHTFAFVKKTVGFCPNVTNKLEHFAMHMLNQGVSMLSRIHEVCPNQTFCPLALESGGCISRESNCSDAGAMRLLNGSKFEDDRINSDRWLARCAESHNVWQCAAEGVAAWAGVNDSMIGAFFNESCPHGTRYCVAEGRCLPLGERCHDVSFHDTCESNQKYCLSTLGCIPKADECPPPFSPLALRMIAILQNAGEIDNTTFHFLYQTGWARFCFLKRIVHTIYSQNLHQCETREAHCRRVGAGTHQSCLDAHSSCMNPIRELGVCSLVSRYCRGMEEHLPDFVKTLLPIMKMNFHIGWNDLCNQGQALCQFLETEIGSCPRANMSGDFCAVADIPRCDNGERFCPRVNACKPIEECKCPDDKKSCNGTCIENGEHCEAGHDECQNKYSSCHRAREGIAIIDGAGHFCEQMMGNPDRFVQFLKNQTAGWIPLLNMACPDGHKFCLFALDNGRFGCIGMNDNCTAIGAMPPGNGGERPKDIAGYFKGGFQTIWNDECPRGFVYCRALSRCVPAGHCSLKQLAHWIGGNNSMVTPFNESCPAHTRYCLSKGRCMPMNESCHEIAGALCNESQQFCYSKFKCIPKEDSCTMRRFPYELEVAALLERPIDVTNKTYRELAHTGWAQFCLMSKALHVTQLRTQGICEARENHCRRDGFEEHQKCLKENSKCWNPFSGICDGGFKVCEDIMRELPDPLRKVLKATMEQLHIREHFDFSTTDSYNNSSTYVVEMKSWSRLYVSFH